MRWTEEDLAAFNARQLQAQRPPKPRRLVFQFDERSVDTRESLEARGITAPSVLDARSSITPQARTLRLPWPPTLNHLYPTVQGRRVLSTAGKAYHQEVSAAILKQWGIPVVCLTARLSLVIEVYPPDKRRRDLSNLVKIIEDSLQTAEAKKGLIDYARRRASRFGAHRSHASARPRCGPTALL